MEYPYTGGGVVMKKGVMAGIIMLIFVLFLSSQSGHAFELNGFADVSFTKSTKGADEFRKGDFAFGELDLYFAQTLDDIDVLVELVVEEGAVLDLERLTLGYTFSDALRLRVGRFHTALGFWNTAYHHGVQLQPTIRRPDFLKFEHDGGVLPVHIIGAYIAGRADTAIGAIEYGAMLGNGPRITSNDGMNVLHPNNISDNNNGKAIALNIAVSPIAIQGLKIGLSGHIAEVKDDGAVDIDVDNADGDNDLTTGVEVGSGDVEVDQTILGAAVIYSIAKVDIAGEYFSIKDTNAKDYTSSAYYGLITYAYKEKWVPYLMYENMSVKEADPYFMSLGSLDIEELTIGLRYNINYRSSLKGEYRRVIDAGDKDWNEYALQWALAF